MELKLQIGEKERSFSPSFISARMLRRTLEVQKKVENGFKLDELDLVVDYMVELFGHQFTRDEYYDGLAVERFLPQAIECIEEVMKRFSGAVQMESEKNG